MKLELKHLAPYLPYKLQLLHAGWDLHLTMNGSGEGSEHLSIEDVDEYAKPYLRPLSQLTEEITHNRVTFVPIDFLDMYPEDLRVIIKHGVIEANMNWHDAQKLFEWHFDVFGLIDAGLAIEKPSH